MDKTTHQVRAQQWTKIMNECINSGMSKTAWCKANGISDKQFFYWQRVLRREAFESMQDSKLPTVNQTECLPETRESLSFAEIKLPCDPQNKSPVFLPDLIIRKGDLILELSNSVSEELLSKIGGILYAK